MRSSGRSSSSAAIWASAVTMPCPSSTLPVNTVALPSGMMRNQASSMRLVIEAAGQRPPAAAPERCGAPARTRSRCRRARRRNARRERLGAFMVRSSRSPAAAAAPRGRCGYASRSGRDCGASAGAHVGFGRMRHAVEQLLGRHDHAVDAVAALRRLLVDERLLQRMRLVDRAETFDGGDLLRADVAGSARTQERIGTPSTSTVQAPHCVEPAAELGAVERKIVAQHVEQAAYRARPATVRSTPLTFRLMAMAVLKLGGGECDAVIGEIQRILRRRDGAVEALDTRHLAGALPRRKVALRPGGLGLAAELLKVGRAMIAARAAPISS